MTTGIRPGPAVGTTRRTTRRSRGRTGLIRTPTGREGLVPRGSSSSTTTTGRALPTASTHNGASLNSSGTPITAPGAGPRPPGRATSRPTINTSPPGRITRTGIISSSSSSIMGPSSALRHLRPVRSLSAAPSFHHTWWSLLVPSIPQRSLF